MNIEDLLRIALEAVLDDLQHIAQFTPNERLPKEEQIRCSVYAAIRPYVKAIQVEARYLDIDAGSKMGAECDLRIITQQGLEQEVVWMEIKRAWHAKGLGRNSGQYPDWRKDLHKLQQVESGIKVFMLAFFTDKHGDPPDSPFAKQIKKLFPNEIEVVLTTVDMPSVPFKWKKTNVRWLKMRAYILR